MAATHVESEQRQWQGKARGWATGKATIATDGDGEVTVRHLKKIN